MDGVVGERNMRKSQILKSVILLSASYFLLSGTLVFAAGLFFGEKDRSVRLRDQFEVTLFLDAADAELNAVEGTVLFPAALLDLKEIRDGNSLVSLWIERPKIIASGLVHFSGIIPGGYAGKRGLLFRILFEAKKEGSGIIAMRDAKALRNDGSGTPIPLALSRVRFSVSKRISGSGTKTLAVADGEPPETFSPEVAQHPTILGGRYFLVFTAQDKGSGISSYAVYESTRAVSSVDSQRWERAESPYLLKDQTLESYIYVQAVDKAGNERVAVLPPRRALFWYQQYSFLLLVLAVIISGILLRRFLRRAAGAQ